MLVHNLALLINQEEVAQALKQPEECSNEYRFVVDPYRILIIVIVLTSTPWDIASLMAHVKLDNKEMKDFNKPEDNKKCKPCNKIHLTCWINIREDKHNRLVTNNDEKQILLLPGSVNTVK